MPKSSTERANAARNARKADGWVEVRLWAKSKTDADALKGYAGELLMRALEPQLRLIAAQFQMTHDETDAALDALRGLRSSEYVTPAGSMLDLMSSFAKSRRLNALDGAFHMHELMHPSSAIQVLSYMPNKIMQNYAPTQLDFRGFERFLAWKSKNPQWEEVGMAAIERGDLVEWTNSTIEQIAATPVS